MRWQTFHLRRGAGCNLVLKGNSSSLPLEGLDADLIKSIWQLPKESEKLSGKVTVVLGQVQRIKQYVFETSGLNEIRGASALLEVW